MSRIDERREILDKADFITDHANEIKRTMTALKAARTPESQKEKLTLIRLYGNLILDDVEELFFSLGEILPEYGVSSLKELDRMISEKADRILEEERRKQK